MHQTSSRPGHLGKAYPAAGIFRAEHASERRHCPMWSWLRAGICRIRDGSSDQPAWPPQCGRRHQFCLKSKAEDFGETAHAKLAFEVRAMNLDGTRADPEAFADLPAPPAPAGSSQQGVPGPARARGVRRA